MSAVLFPLLRITTDWLLTSKYLFALSITLSLSHSLMGIILFAISQDIFGGNLSHQQQIVTFLKASGRRWVFAQGVY